MLTDPKLRSQVDALWDKFWTGPEKRLRSSSRTPKSEYHEPPLDMFGADAVERWFTEKEVAEIVDFANTLQR